MLKGLDLSSNAPWKKRFQAEQVYWAQVAVARPERGLVCTNTSGVNQLYGWNVATQALHPVTDYPSGKSRGYLSTSGRSIYYLADQAGNEIGHYVRVPFEGGEPQDITPQLPPYSSSGFSENLAGTVLGMIAAHSNGFQIYVLNQTESGELEQPRLLWRSPALCRGLTFSCDGDVAVVATTERTGTRAFSLKAWHTATGEFMGELHEETISFSAVCFSPRPGDGRLLVSSDRSGFNRPMLWNPQTGEQTELRVEGIRGELEGWDWSPDGETLLLCELYQARYQLYTYNLATQTLHPLQHPSGSFGSGQFMAAGEILLSLSNAAQPSHLIALNRKTEAIRTVLAAGEVPPGRPWQSVRFPSGDGVEIQAWLALPAGDPPFPTVLHAHGGPTSVMTERFFPDCQAWLDHGFAWLSVNYRGSTTFGREFERAIWGRPGNWEVEDLVAARNGLVAQGIAQAEAILVTGASYGGYLTLQALGKFPELWAGGMAEVAIADWFLMYEDQAETMRGAQRSLFGGTPQEKPEAHRVGSPMTYAEQVSAPILVIQGRNDTRCPARQMQAYEDRLNSLGKAIELHWFEAGHGVSDTAQSLQHQETKLRFAYRVLGRC